MAVGTLELEAFYLGRLVPRAKLVFRLMGALVAPTAISAKTASSVVAKTRQGQRRTQRQGSAILGCQNLNPSFSFAQPHFWTWGSP